LGLTGAITVRNRPDHDSIRRQHARVLGHDTERVWYVLQNIGIDHNVELHVRRHNLAEFGVYAAEMISRIGKGRLMEIYSDIANAISDQILADVHGIAASEIQHRDIAANLRAMLLYRPQDEAQLLCVAENIFRRKRRTPGPGGIGKVIR